MPTQFKISITKEIIARCKNCGIENDVHKIGKNCAVAFAMADIFPDVYVSGYYIYPFGNDHEQGQSMKIPLPVIAQQFIKLFDGFYLTPKLRLLLPEFEFAIDVPDEVIEQINIDEISKLIEGGKRTVCLRNHQPVHC
ncbi:MAG: hypothetical protein ABI861_10485 [Panacibacter sp.]